MHPLLIQRVIDRLREPTPKSSRASRHTYDYLKKHGTKWIDELPCTLWANRASSSRATGETPFFLVYGAEVVIPPEVTMVSPRVQAYDEAV
jgi:hypothetical protein